MQPVLRLSDSPGLLRLGLGELHLVVMLDFGTGFVLLLTIATHFEGSIEPIFDGRGVSFTVRLPERLAADVVEAPVFLDQADVGRFIQTVLAPLVSIGPVPVPALQGFTLSNLKLYLDGPAREFATLDGDLQSFRTGP